LIQIVIFIILFCRTPETFLGNLSAVKRKFIGNTQEIYRNTGGLTIYFWIVLRGMPTSQFQARAAMTYFQLVITTHWLGRTGASAGETRVVVT
jgi:hypothetical protein